MRGKKGQDPQGSKETNTQDGQAGTSKRKKTLREHTRVGEGEKTQRSSPENHAFNKGSTKRTRAPAWGGSA